MAQYTSVEITYGSVTARVELTYRAYVPGNDPWRKTSGPTTSIPSSGDYENRMIGGSTNDVRMSTPSEGLVMTLKNFTRVSVGSTGEGDFYASGYLIPEFSTFNWEVIGINDTWF